MTNYLEPERRIFQQEILKTLKMINGNLVEMNHHLSQIDGTLNFIINEKINNTTTDSK